MKGAHEFFLNSDSAEISWVHYTDKTLEQTPSVFYSLILFFCFSNLVRLSCANIWKLHRNSITAFLLSLPNESWFIDRVQPFMDSDASWWNFMPIFSSPPLSLLSRPGSVSLQCDAEGRCACRAGVTGEKCDKCGAGFHSLGPAGCRWAMRIKTDAPDTAYIKNCPLNSHKWAKEGEDVFSKTGLKMK